MDFQSGQMIADKYILDGELGQGGIATVYKIRHIKLETPFALKILKISTASLKQRLELEAKVQAQIRHPNVVSVLDVIEEDGFLGLVMEFVEGAALDDFLLQERLTLDETEEIFLAILDAMEEAHDNSIVHRDLKPGNVMIQKKRGRFQVKVCDFGLAKALDDEGASNTVSGTTMGTPAYMAPEQVRNSKTVDQKADVFSLGAILYEMVAGKKAFTGTTTWEILSAVTEKQPPSIRSLVPDVPDRFEAAINGALQKQVTKRIPSCTDLREVLMGRKAWTPSKADSLIMDGFDLMSGEYTIETADLDGLALAELEAAEKRQKEKAKKEAEKKATQVDISTQNTISSAEKVTPVDTLANATTSTTSTSASASGSSSAPPEEKSSSNMLMIVGVVVLLLGIGGAFLLGQNNGNNSKQELTKNETPENNVEKTPPVEKDDPKDQETSEKTEEQNTTTEKVVENKTETTKTEEKQTITPVKTSTEKKSVTKVETKKVETKKVEPPKTEGKKLDSATAKEVVGKFDVKTRNSRKIQDCFASQQKLSGTAPKRVPLIITLANTGSVTSATITEGEFKGSSFEKCLQSKFKSLSFATFDPEAKPLKFKYTLKN